jgi:triacylglycerol lipase
VADLCAAGSCHGGNFVPPWINELSYDSFTVGDLTAQWDREEFVELAAPVGANLSGYHVLAVEGGGPGCGTGTGSIGSAYYDWALPTGSIVGHDNGNGVGFVVICFSDTSQEIVSDGKCDVTVNAPVPFTQRSALKNGDTLNLTNACPDGALVRDSNGTFVDAISYEGHIPAAGTYGAYFSSAPNAGTDPGDVLLPRQSLEKTTSSLARTTATSDWNLTDADGDTPGGSNNGQMLTCHPAPAECGNGTVEFGEDCETDGHCASGWQCTGCFCEPVSGATYTRTKYPIVLAHGFLGFDSLLGVVDYWFQIKAALESGGAQVFVSAVSQVNSPQVRGQQLIAQIEQIVASTGKAKVNLIGHSQGALDARYVAAVRPDLVASVTSVAGPHQGSGVADVLVAAFVNGSFSQDIVAYFGNALGDVLALLSGSSNPNDAVAALQFLTSSGAAAFNAAYPQGLPTVQCGEGPALVNGVRYYSWSGTGVVTSIGDPLDQYLALTSVLIPEPNDGLVGRCSSHLGKVLRDDYFLNHLDQVNHVFGNVPLIEVHPKKIFRDHASRLRNAGL